MYSKLELNQISTSANFVLVQKDGNKEIARDVLYYNLDMVISVGYRTNSGGQKVAIYILKQFSKKGYIIDKKRMAKNINQKITTYGKLLYVVIKKKTENDYANSIFENIKHMDDYGNEYWYAGEPSKVLEYKDWCQYRYIDTKFGKAWYNRKSKKEAMSMSKQYTQRDEKFKKRW